MDRLVETALGQAGDFAGASRWRQATSLLAGDLRVAVLGTDARTVSSVAAALPAAARVPWVMGDATDDESLEETLMGVHAVVWATPATTPLRASERALLAALADSAPADAVVVLADAHLLDHLSDDRSERDAVMRRVQRLLPSGWSLTDDVTGWGRDLNTTLSALIQQRKRSVAQRLLRDARAHTALALAELDREVHTLSRRAESLRSEHDAVLTSATQTARHVLGSVRQHTSALAADHSSFIYQLETALPREIDAAPTPVPPEGVAAWLAHVTHTWLAEAVTRWEQAVVADLDGIADEQWLAAAPLVFPPRTAPSLERPASWTHRLVVSGALAGGAALAIAGAWVPGLSVVAGGAAMAALHRLRTRTTPESLADAARTALRAMAQETQDALEAHQTSVNAALDALVNTRTEAVATQLAEVEQRLSDAGRQNASRREEMHRARAVLDARLAAMDDAS